MNKPGVRFPHVRLRCFSWKTFLDIAVMAILMMYVFAGKNDVPFHGDESILIAASTDYYQIVHKHDFELIKYQDPGDRRPPVFPYQLNQVATGSLSMFTIGMAWDVAGMAVHEINRPWEWSASKTNFDYNVVHKRLPHQRLLQIARTPSTLFLALSICIIFGIVWQMTNSRTASYSASLIYTLTPAVLVNGRRAMQEGTVLFFTTLTIYLTIYFIHARAKRQPDQMFKLREYMVIGLAGGFAMAGKHTAGLIVAVAMLAICVAPFIEQWNMLGRQTSTLTIRHIYRVIGAELLSLTVFFLLMPIWWSWTRITLLGGLTVIMFAAVWRNNSRTSLICAGIAAFIVLSISLIYPETWSGIAKPFNVMGETRGWMMEVQSALTDTMQDTSERIIFLIKQAFFADAQYFEVPAWAGIKQIVEQTAYYEGTGLNGHGGGIIPGMAVLGLFIAGIWGLTTRRFDGTLLLMILWVLIQAFVLIIANPFPWQRYYILLYPPVAVFCGLGVRQLESRFRRSKEA